jgi:hypothetical protein
MKFNIGDRVRVRRYNDIPDNIKNKGIGKSAGKDGEIVDVMYSNAKDCYVCRILFDENARPSHTDFPEGSFDLISELEQATYTYEFEYLENVVVARLYEIKGDEKTEIGLAHGHIFHRGAFGVAQAASYALKRIAADLNGGYIDSRYTEGER